MQQNVQKATNWGCLKTCPNPKEEFFYSGFGFAF